MGGEALGAGEWGGCIGRGGTESPLREGWQAGRPPSLPELLPLQQRGESTSGHQPLGTVSKGQAVQAGAAARRRGLSKILISNHLTPHFREGPAGRG